jgi:hypothetical protein
MTLCSAWIKGKGEHEELFFATDSRLNGFGQINEGVKLFDLPRQDSLICFRGDTSIAYPCLTHLFKQSKPNSPLLNRHFDLDELASYIKTCFDSVVRSWDTSGFTGNQANSEVEFLLGGWNWRRQNFSILRLLYSSQEHGEFQLIDEKDTWLSVSFIGDEVNEAYDLLRNLTEADPVDMEPLQVLSRMINDSKCSSIGGSMQIAKVSKSGTIHSFGTFLNSSQGSPYLRGTRIINVEDYLKLEIMPQFINPDTGRILSDEELQECLERIFATKRIEMRLNTEHALNSSSLLFDCYTGKQMDVAFSSEKLNDFYNTITQIESTDSSKEENDG